MLIFTTCYKGEGIHFHSAKYGDINAWKPDRREFDWGSVLVASG